jgi:hypothetical protein
MESQMKIKFTLSLSDETVAAFKTCGTDGDEAVKNSLISELRAFLNRVKQDAADIDKEEAEGSDEDEDEEDEEEIVEEEPTPAPKKKAKARPAAKAKGGKK